MFFKIVINLSSQNQSGSQSATADIGGGVAFATQIKVMINIVSNIPQNMYAKNYVSRGAAKRPPAVYEIF